MSSCEAWIDWMCCRDRLPDDGIVRIRGNTVTVEWDERNMVARFLGHGIVKWTYSGGIEDLVHEVRRPL